MILYISPLLICIVGLIMFLWACKPPDSPNVKTIGLHMFWVGLLAFLLVGLPHYLGIVAG